INLEQGMTADPMDSGLGKLLSPWGVKVGQGVVADAQCGRAPMRAQFGLQVAVPHPPVPVLSFDKEQSSHPALFRLDSVHFPFTAPLETTSAPEGVKVTTLATSSENSWLLTGSAIDLAPKDPREWHQSGPAGPFPLMVAIEGTLPSAFAASEAPGDDTTPAASTKTARVFVAGSSFFLRDEALPQQQGAGGECQMTSNLALALNTVDWLTQDSDLIAIRAKNVEDPPIEVPEDVRVAEEEARNAAGEAIAAAQQGDQATAEKSAEKQEDALERRKEALGAWEAKKAAYRWGNMLGIPALFGLFGFLRWRMRQSRRRNIQL
ncbi:MAG: hypothetical protein KC416_12525, partial [Myxococcales bacterium]|nr:hypothetical protein [Myxococcales bacterium]